MNQNACSLSNLLEFFYDFKKNSKNISESLFACLQKAMHFLLTVNMSYSLLNILNYFLNSMNLIKRIITLLIVITFILLNSFFFIMLGCGLLKILFSFIIVFFGLLMLFFLDRDLFIDYLGQSNIIVIVKIKVISFAFRFFSF